MTEREAWVAIRNAFRLYADTGESEYLTLTGICRAIEKLRTREEISREILLAMRRRMVEAVEPPDASFWWWPLDREGARERVKFIDGILEKL